MLRVGVTGAGGRMGQEVCRAVTAAADLQLAAAIDPAMAGQDLAPLIGAAGADMAIVGDLDAATGSVDVVVDFTVAEAARATLRWCARRGVHAVVGTTGLSDEDLAEAELAFAASEANAVVAPNFAIGAVLLLRFCALAAPWMDAAEIIELHHDGKLDAPSGTALLTAARIADARRTAGLAPYAPDRTAQHVLASARGAAGPGGCRVHSVRLPGLVAHEEVLFGGVGQTLTIRHDSSDRRSFMPGVLLAVRGVADRPGLTVGLDPLLGI